MSFLTVRGKIFVCYECAHRVIVEYEGGALLTQIGDFEVMRQLEIAEELGEREAAEERGFYLYDFGLCESCYEKTVAKSQRDRDLELSELLKALDELYRSGREEIEDIFNEVLEELKEHLTRDDIDKAVGVRR